MVLSSTGTSACVLARCVLSASFACIRVVDLRKKNHGLRGGGSRSWPRSNRGTVSRATEGGMEEVGIDRSSRVLRGGWVSACVGSRGCGACAAASHSRSRRRCASFWQLSASEMRTFPAIATHIPAAVEGEILGRSMSPGRESSMPDDTRTACRMRMVRMVERVSAAACRRVRLW